MQLFNNNPRIPDLWQQTAVRLLQEGNDVVVDAPTGAGKTYVFEMFVQKGLRGQAIYTVPTRALANDKLYEWRSQGWNAGITTGDLAENTDAPVVVATLETQKSRLLRGVGPSLLVIDEYQMLADAQRGINYELAIALAPRNTQLLLLSGSVENPSRVVQWLRDIGRAAELVSNRIRPVPLEEVQLEALNGRLPPSIRGRWPRLIAQALLAEMGPVLVFAPQRRIAEELAQKLSSGLPTADWLELTHEQRVLAGEPLARMLRNRIAFHHSGLSYPQRAGLIEPLAKAGQLRVIVATTGLAAGINFSMRSVLVTEREYQHAGRSHLVRPDELLQMFGRAGRRGLDTKGYVLVAPDKPRVSEARPATLKRSQKMDWPSFIAVMRLAVMDGASPVAAAKRLAERLFSDSSLSLGLEKLKNRPDPLPEDTAAEAVQNPKIREMLNSKKEWERLKPPVKARLGDCLAFENDAWKPALQTPQTLKSLTCGTLYKFASRDSSRCYGRIVPLAQFPTRENHRMLELVRWMQKSLKDFYARHHPGTEPPSRLQEMDDLERHIVPLLPYLTGGGSLVELFDNNGILSARLRYDDATVMARTDSHGCPLLNPPQRETDPPDFPRFAEIASPEVEAAKRTPAELWHQLGLIDSHCQPTRRGVVFSFFNHGEGLAIAAALEDPGYDTETLLYDIANLRAGHRFGDIDGVSSRLATQCRRVYRGVTAEGYLDQGVPPGYGDGASEVIQVLKDNPQRKQEFMNETIGSGDIERAFLEWRSLLNHVAFAPDYDWDRWMDFRQRAYQYVISHFHTPRDHQLPHLTRGQMGKYLCRL